MQTKKWLSDFANSLCVDLANSDYTEEYLLGWFLDPSNVGALNNQIDACYSTVAYKDSAGRCTGICIEPEMGPAEMALFRLNFDYFYFGREAKRALQGSYSSSSWTTLKEGDSSITKVNKSDLARTFNMMMKDTDQKRKDMTFEYLRNTARPQSVEGQDTVPGSYYSPDYYLPYRENIIL
jgi:hypothetical protein